MMLNLLPMVRIDNRLESHRPGVVINMSTLLCLAKPNAFSQQEIDAIVEERWTSSGVFTLIETALASLGYRATFAGFEKLFVFPAEKCSFYPELEALGIHRSDRFPYPGSVSFNLTPNR